jgi:hypothetical protein
MIEEKRILPSAKSPMSFRPNREIVVRHAAGAPEALAAVIRTERELEKLIAGEGEIDRTQLGSVVKKLHVVIADYLESGKGIDISLNPLEILSAITAAIEEAAGHPSPWPDGADARTFFIHGLYDEIIQQPSNIFETKLFPDGSERYIPVSRVTWKACLEHLRDQITATGLKIAQKRA